MDISGKLPQEAKKVGNSTKSVTVIGGGLAGVEASFQAAKRGCDVTLYEMRPNTNTGAHTTDYLGEIVCSNSLGSDGEASAQHLLKNELRALNSIIMSTADNNRVPAGQALAVDRELFAKSLTAQIEGLSNIKVIREEVTELPQSDILVIATGPLTSDSMASSIAKLLGEDSLYFFDAQAPIVDYESIDMEHAFWGTRYEKGDPDYLNCPMTKEEYDAFYEALISAKLAEMHDFENKKLFEACMPIEEIARRGQQTMAFGPLKPVGFIDPKTNARPYAIIQLRKENAEGTALNLVGFQTRLKWGEQKRVFSLIPALRNANFLRYGVMHRNTFINGPKHLAPTLQLKANLNILFAGQITGVEGYIESTSSGILAGINASMLAFDKEPIAFPHGTAIGALAYHVSEKEHKGQFQPSNMNFGILPEPIPPFKKNERRELIIANCIREFEGIQRILSDREV